MELLTQGGSITAEEPVGDGPRGRCYGPVNPIILSDDRVGKGLNDFTQAGVSSNTFQCMNRVDIIHSGAETE